MGIPQRWVRRRLPAAPRGGGAGPCRLVPDNFATHEEACRVSLLDDVAVQGYVRLAPEVGDVHQCPPTIHQHPECLGENVAHQLPVLRERQVVVVLLAHVVGRRCDHQVNRAIRKLVHVHRRVVEDPVQCVDRDGILRRWATVEFGGILGLQGPRVVLGRIVADAAVCAERACARGLPAAGSGTRLSSSGFAR